MMNGGDIRGVDGWFLAGSNPWCFRFQRIHQKLNGIPKQVARSSYYIDTQVSFFFGVREWNVGRLRVRFLGPRTWCPLIKLWFHRPYSGKPTVLISPDHKALGWWVGWGVGWPVMIYAAKHPVICLTGKSETSFNEHFLQQPTNNWLKLSVHGLISGKWGWLAGQSCFYCRCVIFFENIGDF